MGSRTGDLGHERTRAASEISVWHRNRCWDGPGRAPGVGLTRARLARSVQDRTAAAIAPHGGLEGLARCTAP
jgi:hypothetical protein